MVAVSSRQEIGTRGEDLACAELERQGLQILDRNWRCAVGELDIVAAEVGEPGVTLVFCEVKCRSGVRFGHPLETVTFRKLQTLRQLAAIWTRQHAVKARAIRIDVIGIVLAPGQQPQLTHVKAAG